MQPLTISFYLPQFHPTAENSEWWEPGFTEWTNVTKARPLYWGHQQPFLPSELGFYDLRVPECRTSQAALAREYGVSAFCYWHYWFGGRRILERPFEEVLKHKSPDFPFCLAWANQTWSGTWHGAPDRILIEQTYPGVEDDLAHFKYLAEAFSDTRYIKLSGRPILYIFRPEDLPNPCEWSKSIRSFMKTYGFPDVYLVGEMSALTGGIPKAKSCEHYGFDAMVYMRLPALINKFTAAQMRLGRRVFGGPEIYPVDRKWNLPTVESESQFVYPCVYSNWDNTPRSSRRGLVVKGCSPDTYESHLTQALSYTVEHQPLHPIVFVKSWNEWAEGNVLEPSRRFGRGFLEAHLRAVSKFS
jgi:hypothetical protein